MMPSSSISAALASPTAHDRTQPAARGAMRLAARLGQQLRVAQAGRHAAHAGVDDDEADGDGTGDRATADLVARDHERRTLVEQHAFDAQVGDGRRRHQPAASSTPSKTDG